MNLSTTILRIIAVEAERATLYAATSQRWLTDLQLGRPTGIRHDAGAVASELVAAVIRAAA